MAGFAVGTVFVDRKEFVSIRIPIKTENKMAGFVEPVIDEELKIPPIYRALGEDIRYECFGTDFLNVGGFVGFDCCAELGNAGLELLFLGC